jgi:hypothetical protein
MEKANPYFVLRASLPPVVVTPAPLPWLVSLSPVVLTIYQETTHGIHP